MQIPTLTHRPSRRRLFRPAAVIAAASIATFGPLAAAIADEVAAGKFAAAIRASGHPCARVIESASKGNSVWHVRCNAGWYEVTKKDDSTVEVMRLD